MDNLGFNAGILTADEYAALIDCIATCFVINQFDAIFTDILDNSPYEKDYSR
jgi:hypothetical protein